MKILTIFWGENYRSGPQMTRTRGMNDYIRRQILASKSHIKLVNMLKNQGHNLDIILNTYKLNPNDDNNILQYYQKNTNLILKFFYDSQFSDELAFFQNMFKNVLSNEILDNKYDFVLFIRIDLYLKKIFFETLKFIPEKISFAHIDSNINTNSNNFLICQQIFIVPKIYYNILPSLQQHPHYFKDEMIEKGIPIDNITYMINTLHVCSTDLGWNPFYIQVGRSYNNQYNINCSCCSTIEHYYDTKTHTFIHDTSKTTEKWKDYLNIDTLEQNLAELQENSFEELLSK